MELVYIVLFDIKEETALRWFQVLRIAQVFLAVLLHPKKSWYYQDVTREHLEYVKNMEVTELL